MLSWTNTLWRMTSLATVTDWTLVIIFALIVGYVRRTWTFSHFRRRGLPYVGPLSFLGNMVQTILGKKSFSDFVTNSYYRFKKHSIFGIYQFSTPILFVKDPEVIKKVLVKDFDHFVDHQVLLADNVDPILSRSLFTLKDQEWRNMRMTLSPAFTSSKMRYIFKLVDKCGEQMVDFLKRELQKKSSRVYEAETKDLFTRFANDVIATSAFGIQCDSLHEPQNEFYKNGLELTGFKWLNILLMFGYMMFPKLMEILKLSFLSPKLCDFFHGMVHDTIRERKKQGIHRPDMLQLLIQAREGQLKAEDSDEQEVVKGAKAIQLSDIDMTAQAVVFFMAGFETVSTLMSFTALELTLNPDVQERVQQEIDEALGKGDMQLSYEKVQGMKYLDMVLNEVLRLYPPLFALNRVCSSTYTFEAQREQSTYTIRRGEIVWIPVFAMHRDPQYWTDPERFIPERFSEENKANTKPFTYLPFGLGPRICIGSRFALLEAKIAIAHILRNFSFVRISKSPKTIQLSKKVNNLEVDGGAWVGIIPRA